MEKNNKKVLIVEDETSIASALEVKLKSEGFSSLKARNGQDGLDIALEEHPDIILLDIIMPVMDGLTMLKKLRKDAWGKDVPVIILTNLSNNDEIAEAAMNGTYGYLIKSDWKIEDVVEKIKNKLEI